MYQPINETNPDPDPHCASCFQNNVLKKAEYLNLDTFLSEKQHQYLCCDCRSNYKHLIPISSSSSSHSYQSQIPFCSKIIINHHCPEKLAHKTQIQTLFTLKLANNLNELETTTQKIFDKWRNQTESQYQSIISLFDEKSLEEFIDMACETDLSTSELEQQLSMLKHSSENNFNPQLFLQSVSQCYESKGEILEKCCQWKEYFINFDLSFQKTSVDKLYNKLMSQAEKEETMIETVHKYQNQKKKTDQITLLCESQSENKNINLMEQISQSDNQEECKRDCGLEINYENWGTAWDGHKNALQKIKWVKILFDKAYNRTRKLVQQCINLQTLIIEDPRFGSREMIDMVINTHPRLKKLHLNCFNEFSDRHAEILIKKIPKLRQLFYGCNFHRNVGTMDQNEYFKEFKKQKRKDSLKTVTLARLLSQLPHLENIWISEMFDEKVYSQLCAKKVLKHLAIGPLGCSTQKQLDSKYWQCIAQVKGLISLAFINIELDEEYTLKILANNGPTLKCFYLYHCKMMTDLTLNALSLYAKDLEELFLFRCGEQGCRAKAIWHLTQLDTLVIRECQQFDLDEKEISDIGKLSHLSLVGNHWLHDENLAKFKGITKLQALLLGNTNISSDVQTFEFIKGCKHARCLHLAQTRVKGLDIIQIVKQMPFLQKLSLQGMTFIPSAVTGRGVVETRNMYEIGNALPHLTHLDISCCNKIEGCIFPFFPKLRFVNVWMAQLISQAAKQDLRAKGVIVFDET